MKRTTDSARASVRRASLRFVALVPLIIACVLVSRTHIHSVGWRYDLPLDWYGDDALTEESLSFEPPEMVRSFSVERDADGHAHAIIEAGETAHGMGFVNTENGGAGFEVEVYDGVVFVDGMNFTGWEAVYISVTLVILCIGVLCASGFVTLWRCSWYGYVMAVYAGGGIFFVCQAVLFALLGMNGSLRDFSDFALSVTNAANLFVELSMVPMSLIALFVCASNVVLLRREGRSLGNLLGVIASLMLLAAFFGIRVYRANIDSFFLQFVQSLNGFLFLFLLDSAFCMVLAYALSLFLGVSVTALLAARHVPSFPRDYLIILGCGLRGDGTPTPLLAGRVDAARDYARRQVGGGFDAPTFVPSGGQGPDEACSEAASMAGYLGGQTGSRILLEDRSTNTRENMAFSARLIEADADAPAAERRIAFSTTNYHVLRGYVYAHQAGMDAEGIAAPTKLYFWPNAFLREFVGMLAARALPIVMNCLAITALYALLEYLLLMA